MSNIVDRWYLNTREFAFFVFVSLVAVVYAFIVIDTLGLGGPWSFVMGIAYTVGMVFLGRELSAAAKERAGR